MKRNHACSLVHLALFLTLAIALTSCKPSQEAKDAITAAKDPDATFDFLSSSGSALGLRNNLPATFPQVADLMQQDSNARMAMLSRFRTGGMDDDMELAIYAYALEQLGDKSAVFPLRQFVGRSIGGEFIWSPYFAAHAVLSLTGALDSANDMNWYSIYDMRSIAGGGATADATAGVQAAFMEPGSQVSAVKKGPINCTMRYLLVDENNQPLYLSDGKTKAIVEGLVWACPKVPQVTADHLNEQVEGGGGVRYKDGEAIVDGEYGNAPTRQFDCAGYALRELNNYHKWWVDPTPAFKALYESKAIRRVDNASGDAPVKGDKVFYFHNAADTLPGHAAEVHEPGGLFSTMVIWNAAEMSGLWEAKANASFFDKIAGGFKAYKTYRWTAGQPRVIPDPSFAADQSNCLVNPVTDGECPEAKPNPLQRDNSCPANGSLCQWCGGLETGSIWDSYAMVAWKSETKLDQIDYDSRNLNTNESIEWNITFSGGEPYNATITVTHNKITGKGGGGRYTYADGSWSDITSADIDLSFAAWNMTGTIVAHTADGKTNTVEVKAAHCDGTYP